MSDQELLPCPFCGNDVTSFTSDELGDNYHCHYFNIVCKNLECQDFSEYRCDLQESDKLIKFWNSRYRQRVDRIHKL